jgi:hypothetical protein
MAMPVHLGPLALTGYEVSPLGGEKVFVRLLGDGHASPEHRPELLVELDGEEHRFPAIPQRRSESESRPGRWSAGFALPADLEPRLKGSMKLLIGELELLVPATRRRGKRALRSADEPEAPKAQERQLRVPTAPVVVQAAGRHTVAQLQEALDRERRGREAAETKAIELATQLDEAQSQAAELSVALATATREREELAHALATARGQLARSGTSPGGDETLRTELNQIALELAALRAEVGEAGFGELLAEARKLAPGPRPIKRERDSRRQGPSSAPPLKFADDFEV